MAGAYGVTPQEIRKASSDLANLKNNIDTILKKVRSDVSTAEAVWKGDAASTFEPIMTNWHEDSTKLTGALEVISESLRLNAGDYEHNESLGSSALKQAGLGGSPAVTPNLS